MLWVVALVFVHQVFSHSISGTVSIPEKKFKVHESVTPQFLAETRVTVVKDGSIEGTAPVSTSGKFTVRSLAQGKYLVHTSHPYMHFDVVSVVIDETGQAGAFTYDGIRNTSSVPLGYPLSLVPVKIESPYLQEEEFNAFQIFKNPMVIMGLVMLGLVWLMPKMQGGMSPEDMSNMRKELEQEGGIAANLLKSMIPADKNGGKSVEGSIPSISSSIGSHKKIQ